MNNLVLNVFYPKKMLDILTMCIYRSRTRIFFLQLSAQAFNQWRNYQAPPVGT